MKNEKSEIIEVVCLKIGFRRFELKDKIMLLNGERLKIRGVNRHEWNPYQGRAISESDMLKDIEILKKNNINAVRTCHYPNQSRWYDLCDEAGICVMDETNLESHGSWMKLGKCEPSWNVPGSDPKWEACVVDRAASMYERDKNHPSILWWSCGNESYAGTGILAMSRYFHEKDKGRLVHYEGVVWNRDYSEISDVESRMYAAPTEIREYLENSPEKPFILCEYMHSMGNSLGGMESYQRLLEEYPLFQGGFIWDFIDQALYYKDCYGEDVLGYGGDFGDHPTDYAFSGNGIVFADRTEKPAMQDVRYWYLEAEEREKHDEKNTILRKQAEAHINDGCYLSEIKDKTFKIVHGDGSIGISGDDFEVMFSYSAGGPVSLIYEGKECLYRVPKPIFWRASTENDKGNRFPARSAVWAAADMSCTCTECKIIEYASEQKFTLTPWDVIFSDNTAGDIDKVSVQYTFRCDVLSNIKVDVIYTVFPDGKIRVNVKYYGESGLPEFPLFGMQFLMPELQEFVEWEGLSGETYPDRKKEGVFGRYRNAVEVSDYLVPQECNNHMDTVQMRTGNLQFIMNEKAFHFSAIPYTAFELENAQHKEELPKARRTVINILAKMRGVGGIDSWGTDVEEKYRLSAEEDIEYSFYIRNAVEEKQD